MTPAESSTLRRHLVALLDGGQAFATPAKVLAGIPPDARGRRPEGADHSLWQLLEHLRISQRDILDFCVADVYREAKWPDEYWPTTVEPPTDEDWDRSLRTFLDEIEAAKRIALDESVDLFAIVPHGTTQTWLREILLIADHNAHHLGQIILLRKLLGVWHSS